MLILRASTILCFLTFISHLAYAMAEKIEHIDITSDSASVLYGENKAIFSGNVIVIHKDLSITADEMIVLYKSTQGDMTGKVIANGNVKIVMGDDKAQGEYGEYDMENQLMTLRGEVILQQGAKTAKGSEMTYDLKNKNASIASSKNSRVEVTIN